MNILVHIIWQVGIDVNKLDNIIDDVDFSQRLLQEQSVVVLPGQVLYITKYQMSFSKTVWYVDHVTLRTEIIIYMYYVFDVF